MKDINKILANVHFKWKMFFLMMQRNNTFLRKHVSMKLLEVSLECLHFSFMLSEGRVKSPYFLPVWWDVSNMTVFIFITGWQETNGELVNLFNGLLNLYTFGLLGFYLRISELLSFQQKVSCFSAIVYWEQVTLLIWWWCLL